jgi:cholesterol oxidase
MRLSSEFEDLANKPDEVWDVVVVGSGYGAGVSAARLAESGAKRVLVLERGKEYSRFPDTRDGLEQEIHWSGKTERNRLGLYDLHADVDLDVLVGCGLGGTSLINANVSIEADPSVFALDVWPEAIRDAAGGGELAKYVARARAMLRPMQRPGALLPKVAAMARAAPAVRGAHFERLDVNIHFGPPGTNPVGVDQTTCTDCGDCVTGCNVGAKNTLCFTYLPLAKHFGAEI